MKGRSSRDTLTASRALVLHIQTQKPILVGISGGGVDGYFILMCNGLVVN